MRKATVRSELRVKMRRTRDRRGVEGVMDSGFKHNMIRARSLTAFVKLSFK